MANPTLTQQDRQSRHLPWDACYNARELGGYPTESGAQIRMQALIRSDSLYHLTPGGQTALRDYGVRTIIDLRSPHELEREANPFASGQEIYEFIQRLATRNVMSGYPCGGPGELCITGIPYFRPGNDVTRGQSSKIVANAFFPACQTP